MKKKSQIISQGCRLADLGVVLIEAIEAAGGNDDDARRIFKDKKLRLQIGQLVMGKLELGPVSFPVTYDQSLGLRELIERAVGASNLKHINSNITQERFPLKGDDVRTVKCRVEPFLDGETGEEAAKRLTAAGYQLANTGDLAGFLHDHPEEVEKWSWVVALSEDSRWTNPYGRVSVPYADVYSASRGFRLDPFRGQFRSVHGVLVLCE